MLASMKLQGLETDFSPKDGFIRYDVPHGDLRVAVLVCAKGLLRLSRP